jgi:hypothetical protein
MQQAQQCLLPEVLLLLLLLLLASVAWLVCAS